MYYVIRGKVREFVIIAPVLNLKHICGGLVGLSNIDILGALDYIKW